MQLQDISLGLEVAMKTWHCNSLDVRRKAFHFVVINESTVEGVKLV